MSYRLLVVDDEEPIRRLVASYLLDEGFVVEELSDGRSAVERIGRRPPIDLLILDIRMPGLNGVDALREIRRVSDCYVIMLTAAAEETDRLIGLSVGADDYITKPFSPREVVARVKAVLRRMRDQRPSGLPGATAAGEHRQVLEFEELTIDVDHHLVTSAGVEITLTALQFQLLVTMAESPGRVFARHQIVERVWGRDFFGEERIVDVHSGNLRKALGEDAANPRIIGTVRGVGYRFLPRPVDGGTE